MRYPTKEARGRSFLRSAIWRVVGVALLALITYIVTENWITTSLVTVLHHGIFLIVYYLHERLWLKVGWDSKWKPYARVATYEIILGNLILGIITLILIGDLQKMSQITFIYISNKYWMFYAYDWLWGKVRWQTV